MVDTLNRATQANCRAGVWLLCSLLFVMFGCEYVRPTMNAPLTRWDEGYGYRSTNLPPSKTGSSDSLFIVASFSGGGTRASALSYGVLRELSRTPIRWEGRDKRLVDELNIITALSGGSFTAAYYALYGDRIFYDFESRFLRKDWEHELRARIFRSPQRWLRLFGQNLSLHKWCLTDAYAAVGCAGWLSEYTRSGVRPSSARCGLS
jgi:NTE family protein